MMMREHEISDVTPEDETTSMYQCRCRAADPDSDADDHWKNVRIEEVDAIASSTIHKLLENHSKVAVTVNLKESALKNLCYDG